MMSPLISHSAERLISPYGKGKRKVDSKMVGVVAIFAARRYLINILPDHLDQGVSGMDK
jgi:hypothetical protein